ncbi:hypothetical protein QWY31_14860 [Cytophagales bacterium LB-30]|uniref:Uncharacterized protein n=1 Tax=Shiella aurantiaca TaxID=3058365 RepID=A0ABT8F8S1_9BACT|nr:hypothetical protein [Shiella aurantiaca]MDN4166790.1 hypothetical protein [Shiella aurantiaca]
MDKVRPTFHNGLEFIQVSSLPGSQAQSLGEWLPISSYIKLMVNNISLEDCVLYKEYEYWFEYCYQKAERLVQFDF